MGTLHVLPSNRITAVHKGESILSVIRKMPELSLEAPCGGKGICGKCRVICHEGRWTEPSQTEHLRLKDEEIREGMRLACCLEILDEEGDYSIEIPEIKEKAVVLSEYICRSHVSEPLFGEEGRGYGIAVDIGTTTVAAALVDLSNGQIAARASAINPQTVTGADVLSRITYIKEHENGLIYSQRLIVDALNKMTGDMLEEAGISYMEIKGYAVAANCTMLHILLGVDPASLGQAPFTPAFKGGRMMKAGEIGLCTENPRAGLYCLPSVSAFIGADITAGIGMTELMNTSKNVLFIDIGTNGEIVLSKGGHLYACSCAAGPAMEGMNISCGCRGAEGAIEGVCYEEGALQISVIGDAEPKGLCGSGVLETVAALLKTGAIGTDGAIRTENSLISNLLYINGRDKGYYIDKARNIYFSQKDVRQIQLAKGALLSGFRALLKYSDLIFDEIDQVLVAGQFGAHLRAETMTDIGMLPMEMKDRVSYIGNTSLAGAVSVLLDRHLRDVYEEISRKVEYVELGMTEGYSELFMNCLNFPEEVSSVYG